MSRPTPLLVAFLWVGLTPLQASTDKIKTLLDQAEVFEHQHNWEEAFKLHDQALRLDKTHPEVRRRYVHTLRRSWQVRRLNDDSYRKDLFTLEYGQSLRVYSSIFDTLLDGSIERKTLDPSRLLQKGLEELSHALGEPRFLQQYVALTKVDQVRDFQAHLERVKANAVGLDRGQVLKQIRDVALAAQRRLQLKPTVAVLEMACGACYALDEYTSYLTPVQLQALYSSLRGEVGGVGLILAVENGRLVIDDIAPSSAASEVVPILGRGDEIVSIAGKASIDMLPETALALLDGPVGSSVDVQIHSPEVGTRTLSLRRRGYATVAFQMQNETVGYLQITSFQETTLQEVDDALMALAKLGMKGLVLDLRGNTGGLFEVAVEVARRFLASGIIVSTQHQDPRLSAIYHARNAGALGIPLVVLVDEDTASGAEILAGALKDNKRGRLVGQATFGKGCTQSIFRLPASASGIPSGGLRITVSRFFSPEGLPYSGRGVNPHMFVERFLTPEAMDQRDHQLEEAIFEIQRLSIMMR